MSLHGIAGSGIRGIGTRINPSQKPGSRLFHRARGAGISSGCAGRGGHPIPVSVPFPAAGKMLPRGMKQPSAPSGQQKPGRGGKNEQGTFHTSPPQLCPGKVSQGSSRDLGMLVPVPGLSRASIGIPGHRERRIQRGWGSSLRAPRPPEPQLPGQLRAASLGISVRDTETREESVAGNPTGNLMTFPTHGPQHAGGKP